MGYLTRLSAGAMDQPAQAERRPPVRVAPAAAQEPAVAAAQTPVEAAAQELPKAVTPAPTEADTAPTVQGPKPEAAPAPKEEPVQEAQEIPQVGAPPVEPIQLDAPAADDVAARQAHEAAEAKRKADWDAKQAEKRAAEQAELDKLAAMSDDDVISAAAKHISDATEKITRRNMKEQVAEHVQALCRRDPTFARRAMMPGKSMILCFQYITRKAYEYVQDELKANGIKPSPTQEGYGCDIPDDLCFQWARDYFDAPVEKDEEKFVPRPYVPKSGKKSTSKKAEKAKKEPKPKPVPKPKENPGVDGQISLLGEVS